MRVGDDMDPFERVGGMKGDQARVGSVLSSASVNAVVPGWVPGEGEGGCGRGEGEDECECACTCVCTGELGERRRRIPAAV